MKLAALPPTATVARPLVTDGPVPSLLAATETPAERTMERWEERNGVDYPSYRSHFRNPSRTPYGVAGELLTETRVHGDHVVSIYRSTKRGSSSVAVTAHGRRPVVFDTTELLAREAAVVRSAQLVGGTLVVAVAIPTADGGRTKEVRVAAFDASSGELSWATGSLGTRAPLRPAGRAARRRACAVRERGFVGHHDGATKARACREGRAARPATHARSAVG